MTFLFVVCFVFVFGTEDQGRIEHVYFKLVVSVPYGSQQAYQTLPDYLV